MAQAGGQRSERLEEALETAPELKERLGAFGRVQSGGPTPRAWAPGIPGAILGYRDEELLAGVFELAGELKPDGPQPVGLFSSPSRKAWLVVRVEELMPVTEDVYERVRDQVRSRLVQQRLSLARADWFSPQRIEERTGWSLGQQGS